MRIGPWSCVGSPLARVGGGRSVRATGREAAGREAAGRRVADPGRSSPMPSVRAYLAKVAGPEATGHRTVARMLAGA